MATDLKAYAVRQKSTGLFIPRLETGRKRGGSRLEFSNEREPRLFHNKPAAKAFLGNWLRGIFERGWTGDGDDFIKIIKKHDRNRDDTEIVEFELKEIK